MFDATMRRTLVAVVVLALLASGCGAAENDPNLAEAAAMTEDAGSSRFELSGTESDGNERVEIRCAGEADYRAERARLSCTYGGKGALELVAVGRENYLRGDLYGFGGGSDKWVRLDDDEPVSELSPKRLLSMLRGASQSTERVGDEQVRGVDTVRFRLEVDCEHAELRDCAGTTAPVEVWVGDDGLVRRIAVDEGLAPFTIEFFDFGTAVNVERPPASEVEDLGGLFGAVACKSGFGTPIGLDRATNALRLHGFTIAGEPQCSSESASFENDAAARPAEGHVYCVLRAAAPEGAPTSVQPLGTGVAATALRLQNLECTLVADAGAEAKLARLSAALAELER